MISGKRIDTDPPTLYTPEDAEDAALSLSEFDSEWEYRVKHDPKGTGFSIIEVFDENGEFISAW